MVTSSKSSFTWSKSKSKRHPKRVLIIRDLSFAKLQIIIQINQFHIDRVNLKKGGKKVWQISISIFLNFYKKIMAIILDVCMFVWVYILHTHKIDRDKHICLEGRGEREIFCGSLCMQNSGDWLLRTWYLFIMGH